MKDVVNRASSWIYKQLPTASDTKRAVEASSTYANGAAKGVRRACAMGDCSGHMFVRLAGLSGAVAVAFGAYGAHGKPLLFRGHRTISDKPNCRLVYLRTVL